MMALHITTELWKFPLLLQSLNLSPLYFHHHFPLTTYLVILGCKIVAIINTYIIKKDRGLTGIVGSKLLGINGRTKWSPAKE